MAIKHPPFEDVFPIEHGDFPASHVSELRGVSRWLLTQKFDDRRIAILKTSAPKRDWELHVKSWEINLYFSGVTRKGSILSYMI